MLLFPKQPKYNKSFSRKKVPKAEKVQDSFVLGDFSIVARESGRVTNRQIETIRRLLRRCLKKQAKI
jgi:ribosomal protein L16/L10AE